MANFGFSRLAVVAPYAPHWREARSAIGAPDLLQAAEETESLAEAIEECTLVLGTGTLTHRKPEQQVVTLPSLAPLVRQEIARGGRVAILFGPEKHGLTREDLSHCHVLVEIPTNAGQPSMNLGQAVAVCLYELATRVFSNTPTPSEEIWNQVENVPPAATSGNLDTLAKLIEQAMAASDYSPRAMQPANRYDLRLLLRRLHLNLADTRRALGLFRRILWRIEREQQQDGLPR
jgi:TrmH family RNA methyltransferase